MSFFSDIMNGLHLKSNDDYDLDDDYGFEDEYDDEPRGSGFSGRRSEDDYDMDEEEEVVTPRLRLFSQRKSPEPVRRAAGFDVVMVRPSTMDEARVICDHLLNGTSVVLNMEGFHGGMSQRIADFVCGSVYAIGGSLQGISNNIFIATPDNVNLTGDFKDLLRGTENLNNVNGNIRLRV